jgi:hypothetical protein
MKEIIKYNMFTEIIFQFQKQEQWKRFPLILGA